MARIDGRYPRRNKATCPSPTFGGIPALALGDLAGQHRGIGTKGPQMARSYDRLKASAESRLEALDDAELVPEVSVQEEDAPAADGASGDGGTVVDPHDYGIHVDDPGSDLLEDDLDAGLRDDEEATALDALAEVFNARDLDGLMQVVASDGEAPGLLGYDRANLPAAIEDLWQRRPTCCLTRGYHADAHVGVLWEHDGSAWWRVATVHLDDVEDGLIGVIEFADDPALLEQLEADPPDPDDLDEGARWTEWDEGADAESGHNHL